MQGKLSERYTLSGHRRIATETDEIVGESVYACCPQSPRVIIAYSMQQAVGRLIV